MTKRGVPFPLYTPTKSTSDALEPASKRPTHFFLQSPGVSPGLGAHSTPYSQSSTPSHSRRPSRASLAALRSALQQYHVPSEDDLAPLKSVHHEHKSGDGPGMDVDLGAGDEYMDAMVEIHRVLYRGREEMDGKTPHWSVQGPEVQRVVERWFEADCTYDHPFLRLSTRRALLAHFVLLHLVSTAYLPSPTPSSILYHARNVTFAARRMLLGSDIRERDLEAGSQPLKGVQLPSVEEEWMGLAGKQGLAVQRSGDDRWWRVWDVSADCTEIGGMETYDGYHLGLIEHVVTLTLFPSLSRRRPAYDGMVSPSTSSVSTLDLNPPSFTRRLATALADEFDTLLHWDLPISTVVHFNEVGKATHVRDMVDVRDVVEAVVPFAKRFGWLTRRVTGLLSSTLGSFVLAVIPGPKVTITPPVKLAGGVKSGTGLKPLPVEMEIPSGVPPPRPFGGSGDEGNTLGLEGVAGPDI